MFLPCIGCLALIVFAVVAYSVFGCATTARDLFPLSFVTATTFLVLVGTFARLASRLFQGSCSLDFPSNEAYRVFLRKQQLLCREFNLAAAVLVGLTTGLLNCWWNSYSAVPLLVAFTTLEAFWLLLTYVVWRPQEQHYLEWRRLLLAFALAAVAGAVTCLFAQTTATPFAVGGVLFWLSFLLLIPL